MNDSTYGVRIAGVGSAVPDRRLTNQDFEKMFDTSDEWITTRTGIRERRVVDQKTEGTFTLSVEAVQKALDDAGIDGSSIDLLINASVSSEMTCPSNGCRVAHAIGAVPSPAFDLVAACSGFVYGLNVADPLIRGGAFKRIAVVGCDSMSTLCDYKDRSVSILFGDAAGAVILERDEDTDRGSIYSSMKSDATNWPCLYIPRREQEVQDQPAVEHIELGKLRMLGREVYKFAVPKLIEMIEEALAAANLSTDDVSQFVCHQSNARIIESAIAKLGLPAEKVHMNIQHYGNSSAGSVGLCLDEVWRAGKIKTGDIILIAAVGGGMTWAVNLWRV